MTKYRILEEDKKFYPQYESNNYWFYFLLPKGYPRYEFDTLDDAKNFIDIELGLKPRQIIHEYKPKENDKV